MKVSYRTTKVVDGRFMGVEEVIRSTVICILLVENNV